MAGWRSVFLATAVCLFVMPGQNAAFPGLASASVADACINQCLCARPVQHSLVVTARDSAGRILKVVSVELPAGAREISPLPTDAPQVFLPRIGALGSCDEQRPTGRCAARPGLCVQTHFRVYEVSREYLILVYSSAFRNGEFTDFWIDQFRVARTGNDR